MDGIKINFIYPHFLRRFLCFISDLFILTFFLIICTIISSIIVERLFYFGFSENYFVNINFIIYSVITFLYFILFPIFFKRTLGNIIFNIKLVDDLGNELKTGKIIQRNLVFLSYFLLTVIAPNYIPFYNLNFYFLYLQFILNIILIIFYFRSSKRQLFYDQLTGCHVIYKFSEDINTSNEYDNYPKMFFATLIDSMILVPFTLVVLWLGVPFLNATFGCTPGFFSCLGESITYASLLTIISPVLYFLVIFRKKTFGEKIMNLNRDLLDNKGSLRNFLTFYSVLLLLPFIYYIYSLFILLYQLFNY